MNINDRLKKLEETNRIGEKFNDICRCNNPMIKIFTKDNRPPDYPPNHCWNCRKREAINFNKMQPVRVIIPTVDGKGEIDL